MHSFELRHVFPWPQEQVWAALDSAEYSSARTHASRGQSSNVVSTPISDDPATDGQPRVRKVRHTVQRDLPRLMRRFTGPTLSYLVTETIDSTEFIVRWSAEPELRTRPGLGQRVDIRGTYAFDPHPEGCERIVKARIEVAIPGLGGRIEQGIGKSLRQTHAASADFARTFLQERLG